MCFAVTTVTASNFVVLQAAQGIALKVAVYNWYTTTTTEEKAMAFRVAEGII
jgi:hypothetical protein